MRKRFGLVAAAMLVLGMALPAGAAEPAGVKVQNRLSKQDRVLLAEAEARGQKQVTVLAVFDPQMTRTAEEGLLAKGGVVRYRDADLGYIRASVPTEKVAAIAAMDGLQALTLNKVIPLSLPQAENLTAAGTVEPPGPATPTENPYMPTRDIGAPQFVAEHPTFDGRGVVIGIVDTGVDLLHPALQTARALDGTEVPKFRDWVTGTDPLEDNDPTWISMATEVPPGESTFTHGGVTYTLPHLGPYRFGIFDERDPRMAGSIAFDVNRDGNPEGSRGEFAMLWDFPLNTVYVDANQNFDFTDDLPMRDYRINHDVGTFGADNPDTALRETVPFVVQTDRKNHYVNIGIVSHWHGTHVAGAAAGSGFFDGAFDGAAPGAQLVSLRTCGFASTCLTSGIIEGVIYLAKEARVDLINLSLGIIEPLNDGNGAWPLLYDRLTDRYGVQMFIAAGNMGPGLNTVNEPSTASKAISVGAYFHRETWLSALGAAVNKEEGVYPWSSRGPREDGGFKPDILASGAAVSAIPQWEQGYVYPGTYELPPGYVIAPGTSVASPQATGGAALLLSAAKQSGLNIRPEHLRAAIRSSARFLEGYGAHEQGMGLMNVPAAWAMLAQRPDTVPAAIEATAPASTVMSGALAQPHRGSGLYEREGWAPGDSGTRAITLVRKSGDNSTPTYNLKLLGNDGTFALPAGTIDLRLNKPETLEVTINPTTSGVHSAILLVDDPATPVTEHQMMLTVVAAEQFSAANNFAARWPGAVGREDQRSFYFHVPAGTPGFNVTTNLADGQARVWTQQPDGLPVGVTDYMRGPAEFSLLTGTPGSGVWEVSVETFESAAGEAAFALTAAVVGVDMTPGAWRIEGSEIGHTYSQTFSMTNRYGSFEGRAAGTRLGSAAESRPTIDTSGHQLYYVQVEPGSDMIEARIGNAADSAADLDLVLHDCSSGECVMMDFSVNSFAEEAVSAANPNAGLWIVQVIPFDIPAGSTAYDYLDVFTNPQFGSIHVADSDALRSQGATWSAEASVRADTAPAPGRFLRGFVEVRSGSAVLKSVEVRLENIAP